ncbi:hypothetical protein FRC02_000765 [Tulasnella sp. 418]|nr:hypothetical protein FRC02_000765 [Tulasnella sp. 418]
MVGGYIKHILLGFILYQLYYILSENLTSYFMSTLPAVALAGATGNIGSHIARGFLTSESRSSFSDIIILTRDLNNEVAQGFKANHGATIRQVDFNDEASIEKALEGVTVVVDALGAGPGGKGLRSRELLLEAASKAGAKIYFPSEYGVDVSKVDYSVPIWRAKQVFQEKARATSMKIITVTAGIFMESAFTPGMGFDTANLKWTIIGSPNTKFTVTSKGDVGLSVASFASIAVKTPDAVPNDVRIAGHVLSFEEARQIFTKDSGDDIKYELLDLESTGKEYREKAKTVAITDSPLVSFVPFLRLALAEGMVDYSTNNNDLINSHEKSWKWKKVEDYSKEVNGRPYV